MWSWFILRNCPEFAEEKHRKLTHDGRFLGLDLNPGPPKYETNAKHLTAKFSDKLFKIMSAL
jgi:hypothetical protein